MSATATRFRNAVDRRDIDVLETLFTPDVCLFSPVKFTPFEGRAQVIAVLGVLMRHVFDEFAYVGELDGHVAPSAGDAVESHVLVFRAVADGLQVHGIDLLHLDEDGLITEITVMVRPLSAVTALSTAVLAGLTAEGFLPEPT